MNTEQAKQLSEDALDRLMAALEAGQSESLKSYLAVMARFHRYSWGNCLMIHFQRPNATHVAGFQAWLKLKRIVRKGEKGIVILAPMVGRIKAAEELSEDQTTRLFGFRAAHVFDLSQTDGEPLPEFATVHGDPGDLIQRLTEFVGARGIAIEYSDRIRPAHGMSGAPDRALAAVRRSGARASEEASRLGEGLGPHRFRLARRCVRFARLAARRPV